MGIFDFLKARKRVPAAGAEASESRVPVASDDDIEQFWTSLEQSRPREWHYAFAHHELPGRVLAAPARLRDRLGDEEATRTFVMTALYAAADQSGLGEDELAQWAAQTKVSRIFWNPETQRGMESVFVELPEPTSSPEAYFVAIVLRSVKDTVEAEYFTLERTDGNRAVLCGWTADRQHLNFGIHVKPDFDAFLAAVAERT